jgi:hypothetical protein
MHESHKTASIGDSRDSVCVVCGVCSCHHGGYVEDLECSFIIGHYPNRAQHHGTPPIPNSEDALNKLRRKLNGEPEPVGESEAKFNFELRRTALEWVEKNFSNVISPRNKMELVEATEHFLRTGSFQEKSTPKAINDLAAALIQTRDYVQPSVDLPAIEGWSWYDALKEHAPFVLQQVLEADARAHARKTAESDENEMEDGDPTTND